jgi:hypothetical protein
MKSTNVTQNEFAQAVARAPGMYLGPVEHDRPWTIDGRPATRHQVMTFLADYARVLDDRAHFAHRDTSLIQMRLRTGHPDAYRLLRTVAYWLLEVAAGRPVPDPEPARCLMCGQKQP